MVTGGDGRRKLRRKWIRRGTSLESCIFEPVADGVPNVRECLRCRVIKFPRPCERVALPTRRSMGAFYWSGSKVSFYVFYTALTSTQKAESTYKHSWRAFCPSLTIFFLSAKVSRPSLSIFFGKRKEVLLKYSLAQPGEIHNSKTDN